MRTLEHGLDSDILSPCGSEGVVLEEGTTAVTLTPPVPRSLTLYTDGTSGSRKIGLPWGRGKQPRSHEGRSRSACAGGPTAAYYSTPPRLTQPPWEFNGKSALQMHCECSLDVT